MSHNLPLIIMAVEQHVLCRFFLFCQLPNFPVKSENRDQKGHTSKWCRKCSPFLLLYNFWGRSTSFIHDASHFDKKKPPEVLIDNNITRDLFGNWFSNTLSAFILYVTAPTALFVRFSRFEVMIDGVILSGERLAVDMISHLKSKSLGCYSLLLLLLLLWLPHVRPPLRCESVEKKAEERERDVW